ncbi:DDE_Tnp_IS1595 domain-containing protein [Caerostris darwini]|uniref:DDE_Tnp_IS1595 domain-containing protein n=1 Tax=Caerostris darwini TaxID=1538125 RepID=A0AAV4TZX9_9ARAC|nr:DDE_Tnp_IS1595 domain-containing protein [Caerostris darwini]
MNFRFLSPLIRSFFFRNTTWFQRRTMKTVQEDAIKDEPIKFSSSEAGQWKSSYSFRGPKHLERPRIQPLVVVMSLTAFMVYFCVLREENDLDDWLRNIEQELPLQLEEAEIRAKMEQAKLKKADTTHFERSHSQTMHPSIGKYLINFMENDRPSEILADSAYHK